MKKRVLSLALILATLFSLCPTVLAVQPEAPAGAAAIRDAWEQIAVASYVFDEEPASKPYEPGRLSDEFLQSGLDYLNFVRMLAGLPAVEQSLNQRAQYGAVLLAANDKLESNRPADMDEAFYQQAVEAVANSVISRHSGYAPVAVLRGALDDMMQGVAGELVAQRRRQLLNPQLRCVGFGYAQSKSGNDYVLADVSDRRDSAVDYDYIAWPSAGDFPTELLDPASLWSVALNPEQYQISDAVQICLTRQSDETVWSFDQSTGTPETAEQPYCRIDAENNEILFHPGTTAISAYDGTYTVRITGLTAADGTAAELEYSVNFFRLVCIEHSWGQWEILTEATCTTDGLRQHTCTVCGHVDEAVLAHLGHAYEVLERVESTCRHAGYERSVCERCGREKKRSLPLEAHQWGPWIVTKKAGIDRPGEETSTCSVCGRKQYRAIPPLDNPFVDLGNESSPYFTPILWAVREGITTGTSSTTFSPDRACTRGQFVTFLWRAAGSPAPKSTVSPFTDVQNRSQYYYQAVLWAVERGITTGVSPNRFDPEGVITRSQAAAFFYRYDGSPPVSGKNPFLDVPQAQYYYRAVLWAVSHGITNGTSATAFSPNAFCTRGQMAAFLYRYHVEPLARE